MSGTAAGAPALSNRWSIMPGSIPKRRSPRRVRISRRVAHLDLGGRLDRHELASPPGGRGDVVAQVLLGPYVIKKNDSPSCCLVALSTPHSLAKAPQAPSKHAADGCAIEAMFTNLIITFTRHHLERPGSSIKTSSVNVADQSEEEPTTSGRWFARSMPARSPRNSDRWTITSHTGGVRPRSWIPDPGRRSSRSDPVRRTASTGRASRKDRWRRTAGSTGS